MHTALLSNGNAPSVEPMRKLQPTFLVLCLATTLIACDENDGTVNMWTGVATSAEAIRTVTTLPLKTGYYVTSTTPCGEASNATTMLVRRSGISGARDFCEFTRIEQIGPRDFRVLERCSVLIEESPPETNVVLYTLHSDTSFTSTNEHGGVFDTRHCAQEDMPWPWRENDLTDLGD